MTDRPYITASPNIVCRRFLGLQEYLGVLHAMSDTAKAVADKQVEPQIWFLEHCPVVTCGRRTSPESIHAPAGTTVVTVNRGGEATWHGPGQLVVYPLLPIPPMSVKRWVQDLLDVSHTVLENKGVPLMDHRDRIGLWTAKGKILSLGLHMQYGVSTHGLAINVDLDPNGFEWIDPCGERGATMDQVQSWSSCPISELANAWYSTFMIRYTP